MKRILLCLILLKNALIAMKTVDKSSEEKAGFFKMIYPPKHLAAKIINIPFGFLLRPLFDYNGKLRKINKKEKFLKEMVWISSIAYLIKLIYTGIDLQQPSSSLLKQFIVIPSWKESIRLLGYGIAIRHATYCIFCEPETKETYMKEINQELKNIQSQKNTIETREKQLQEIINS